MPTNLNKGERLDFFTVESYERSLMTLKIKDIHLDVMAVLKLSPNNKSTKTLSLTTSVKTHNHIGKYYMKLIIPWHKYIVRLMFRKLTEL
jgi:hypothetical protein